MQTTSDGEGARLREGGGQVLMRTALESFREQGYHGTSVRTIVRKADMTVAALYYHFESKHEILYRAICDAMEELARETERALAAVGEDPARQLGAIVRAHVEYHAEHQTEAFVGNTELRSLQPDARAHVLALRDRHEATFEQVIARATRLGPSPPSDEREAARALLAMCTAVATWYRKGRERAPAQFAERYVELALRIVGAVTP